MGWTREDAGIRAPFTRLPFRLSSMIVSSVKITSLDTWYCVMLCYGVISTMLFWPISLYIITPQLFIVHALSVHAPANTYICNLIVTNNSVQYSQLVESVPIKPRGVPNKRSKFYILYWFVSVLWDLTQINGCPY